MQIDICRARGIEESDPRPSRANYPREQQYMAAGNPASRCFNPAANASRPSLGLGLCQVLPRPQIPDPPGESPHRGARPGRHTSPPWGQGAGTRLCSRRAGQSHGGTAAVRGLPRAPRWGQRDAVGSDGDRAEPRGSARARERRGRRSGRTPHGAGRGCEARGCEALRGGAGTGAGAGTSPRPAPPQGGTALSLGSGPATTP